VLIRNVCLSLKLTLEIINLLAQKMVFLTHAHHINSFFFDLVRLFSEILLDPVDDFLFKLQFSGKELPPILIIFIIVHFIIYYNKWEIT